MAPALTEPLSPTEKLSSSTATPATRSSSRKIDSLASTSTSISLTTTTVKEKKNRITGTNPTTSTRVTRSKDAYQRVFEQALTHTPVASSTNTNSHTTPNQNSANDNKSCNDQMGLSAALNNNNNKNNHSPDQSSTPITTICQDNSTEQLLADLTNDFEEAITAEICLRKQLEDVNLGKSASDSHTESEAKDILVIKGGSGSIAPSSGKPTQTDHMESPQKTVESTPSSSQLQSIDVKPKNETATKREKTDEPTLRQESEIDKEPLIEDTTVASEKPEGVTRTQVLSVEELPPISTDSTMTASEVEDNLEERLSQLDGTAILPIIEDISGVVDGTCNVPATPPRTPTQHQTHQQQVLQLQQQLQQTPPTPLCQQVQQQQHALTPQSTSSSVNTLGSASFMKETTTSGSAELEDPDIEEVLKALKGFDPSSGGDALPDLNVLFNEVYTTLNNYEEISSQPTSTGVPKPNPVIEMLAEIEKKQQSMQRKMDFLLRRMRKLQARNMCKHTSEEVAGLFEYSARVASRGSSLTHSTQEEAAGLGLEPFYNAVAARSTRPLAVSWSEEQRNPVSAAQIFSMLRKLETVSNAQQLCTSFANSTQGLGTSSGSHGQLRKSKKAAQDTLSGLPVAATVTEPTKETVVPILTASVAEEMAFVAGLLQTEMREVQNAIDSDATESSSGGESADEMVTYNNQVQQSLSIAKRAAWRYSRDRAAIASRWSWLLSQIADLEIKIRQHSELHQEVVRTKGTVICGSPNVATSAPTSSVNGYKSDMSLSANTVLAIDELKDEGEAGELPGSCRTRGYIASQFRKRKLLQTTNIHTVSKKAARPSTIKCGCQWPLHPCALCTGRCDPTTPRDLPDTMMMPDRIALLDPGYHPVLSFPEDVSNSLHFEAIARLPEWQQRVMRCQAKSIAKGVWKAEREAAAAAGHHSTTKRRYIKKKDRIAAADTAAAATATTTVAANASSDAGSGGGTGGNGTGTLSTTSATPLVANKLAKNAKKLHCHLVGDGILLEPLSPLATNSNHSGQSQSNSYIHQTSDYPHPQSCDPYNHNQTHLSSISNSKHSSKNNKHRKLSSTSATAANTFHHHHPSINHLHQQHYYNNSQYYYNNNNSNGGSDTSLFYMNENNWDSFGVRSRNSSPTHGGGGNSSNYHKYERSLDRKNRSSYDIDNIVIPYSVAAATRVEILPYKEIPTPKWRVIDEDTRKQISETCETNAEKTVEDQTEDGEKGDFLEKQHATTNGFASETYTTDAVESGECLATKTTTQTNITESDLPKESKDVEMKAIMEEKYDDTSEAEAQQSSSGVLLASAAAVTTEKERPHDTVLKNAKDEAANSEAADSDETIVKKDTFAETQPAAKKLKIENAEAQEIPVSVSIVTADNSADDLGSDMESEDVADEDISDDAMVLRHERALTEERRKFQTFLKFPWSTRSRANRRIDSRAESSGANTPDPTSPAPNTPSVGGGDQESIPSPLAPSTPLNPLDSVSEAGESALVAPPPVSVSNNLHSKRYERRRTTSAKKEPERRSSSPDPKEFVPPYEPLRFPLPDEVFENLLQIMPSEFQDTSKSEFEDCQNISIKYTRSSRNSFRIEPLAASSIRRASKSTAAAMNCDVTVNSSRKQKAASNKVSRAGGAGGAAWGGRGTKAIYENGKAGDVDDAADAALDEEDEQEDDEDEDYPRHHLAPPPEDDVVYTQHDRGDDAYDAYVGGTRGMLGESDGESSDMEPFQDDDPNDPEWKGESAERAERLRRKL